MVIEPLLAGSNSANQSDSYPVVQVAALVASFVNNVEDFVHHRVIEELELLSDSRQDGKAIQVVVLLPESEALARSCKFEVDKGYCRISDHVHLDGLRS